MNFSLNSAVYVVHQVQEENEMWLVEYNVWYPEAVQNLKLCTSIYLSPCLGLINPE